MFLQVMTFAHYLREWWAVMLHLASCLKHVVGRITTELRQHSSNHQEQCFTAIVHRHANVMHSMDANGMHSKHLISTHCKHPRKQPFPNHVNTHTRAQHIGDEAQWLEHTCHLRQKKKNDVTLVTLALTDDWWNNLTNWLIAGKQMWWINT